MTASEFRDMVAAVCDANRSLRSAGPIERDAEACRVQRLVAKLREATWPKRLSDGDRQKALRAMDAANAEVAKA
jgi:hypothetical protein